MKIWFWCCLVLLSFVYLGCEDEYILPPATTMGYNTFGCVVNGELFKMDRHEGNLDPRNYYSSDSTRVYGSADVEGSLKTNVSIMLIAKKIDLEEGKTYQLSEPKSGQAYARISFGHSNTGYTTEGDQSGEWTITKLDKTKKIISGYFWFDITGKNGSIYKVSRGRFDVSYSERIVPIDPYPY